MSARDVVRRRNWPRRRLAAATGALAALALVGGVIAQSASGWDLSFRATSGGGGTSTGGNFGLTGSIGQPFTSSSTGAGFGVYGGLFGGGVGEKFRRFVVLAATDGT